MKLGWAAVQSVAGTLALAGLFAAPLHGQAAPAMPAGAIGTQQTGAAGAQQAGANQPTSDVIPVIVMFTGADEWDYVGSTGISSGLGGQGTNGGASTQAVASGAGVQPTPPIQSNSAVASMTPNNVETPAGEPVRLAPLAQDGPVRLAPLAQGGQGPQPTGQDMNAAIAAALPGRTSNRWPPPQMVRPAVPMGTRMQRAGPVLPPPPLSLPGAPAVRPARRPQPQPDYLLPFFF